MNFSSNAILPARNNLSSPWIIFFATTLGALMVNIDVTIVNVALPIIAKNYVVSMEKIQWIISGYVLAVCILLPICGRLSDIYTKRFIYLLGFSIFTIGSALCSIAGSLATLIVYRVVQGVGAAMIMSNNQAFIVMNFPQEMQGRALGVNSMSASFGAIAGPALGGFLLSILSWRSIFYINIPIGIVGCVVGYYVLPRNEKRLKQTLDVVGAFLFAGLIGGVLWALNNIGDGNILTWQNLFLLLVSCCAGLIFVKWQKRTIHPTINFSLFKNLLYRVGNVSAFIVFMVLGGNSILLPFYLHDILQFTPGIIGVVMFIGPCVTLVFAPLSGYLADKFSSRIFMLIGLIALAIGLFLQGSVTVSTALWAIVVYQIIIGIGFTLFQPPNNLMLFKNVAVDEFGMATGINALMRNIGRVFGVILVTSIFALLYQHISVAKAAYGVGAQTYTPAFFYGFRAAFYCLGAVVLVALYKNYKIKTKTKVT